MSKKEITIIKFDQMDMMEIRKQLLHTGGGQINKDVYARLILLCVGSDEVEWLGPQSYSTKFPSQAAIYLPCSSDHIILTSEFTLRIDKSAYLRGLEGE